MGFAARLCLCLLLVFTIVASASARTSTISFSGNDQMVLVGGRSLKVLIDDYGEPSANRGHDPPRSRGAGGSSGGGRKSL
ncbi:hypothetical protein Ddye_022480 [Dipteronia dyeriana]|uniref:Uncharacterized protein n=1 Tax=Dipteronia dyeriana TaxID=168575 RepID=A0AAD9TR63_9ROSI|nr:hypothetical protein Ddye_022480 [Dipteronia dyeriana]